MGTVTTKARSYFLDSSIFRPGSCWVLTLAYSLQYWPWHKIARSQIQFVSQSAGAKFKNSHPLASRVKSIRWTIFKLAKGVLQGLWFPPNKYTPRYAIASTHHTTACGQGHLNGMQAAASLLNLVQMWPWPGTCLVSLPDPFALWTGGWGGADSLLSPKPKWPWTYTHHHFCLMLCYFWMS